MDKPQMPIEYASLTSVDQLNRLLLFVEDLTRQGFQVTIRGDINVTVNTAAPETTTVDTRIETARDG